MHDASEFDRYKVHNHDNPGNNYAHWYIHQLVPGSGSTNEYEVLPHNTWVTLAVGSEVKESVYGAGYGAKSVVAGNTQVDNNGGLVNGDIFGGGYSGNIRKMRATDTGYQEDDYEQAISNVPTDAHDNYTVNTVINMLIRILFLKQLKPS